MAEYSANAVQTVAPGQSVVFTTTTTPCNRGLIIPRLDAGSFILKGISPRQQINRCCCSTNPSYTTYLVYFGANIAATVAGPISLTITIDGSQVSSSQMIQTPTVVGAFFDVSRARSVEVPCGCCQSVAIENTSTDAIQVQNANIIIVGPNLYLPY